MNASNTIIDAKAELCVASGHADYPNVREHHAVVKYGMLLATLTNMLDYYSCSNIH